MADLARLVDRYEDAAVRDLAWLLFAPDLLRASHAGAELANPFESAAERDATLTWLDALDRDPAPLHAQSRNPKLTRLGFYAESLLEYFLTHGPAAELVAANVPLRRQRRTIGECDFLLQTARGARLHWELAVKFYLHIGDGSSGPTRLSDYVGPNLQDRFDLKHARLLTHQLALSSRAEFASLGFEGPWQAQLYIKGRLFYHSGDVTPAPEVGEAHLRGWWSTASEWRAARAAEQAAPGRDGRAPHAAALEPASDAAGLALARAGAGGTSGIPVVAPSARGASQAGSAREENSPAAYAARAWVVQPRLAWLAPRRLTAADGEALLAHGADIHERLHNAVSPTMVAAYARQDDDGWIEESRGFVVPDDWPERARAFAVTTI